VGSANNERKKEKLKNDSLVAAKREADKTSALP
jgi:hypothetical protein